MPATRIKKYLDDNNVKYSSILHPETMTAMENSFASCVHPQNIAKVVIIKAPEKLFMVVLGANHHIDLQLLSKSLNKSPLAIAKESEFQEIFPDCEVGAMPPFGNIYGLEVLMSDDLLNDENIVFNAGNHHELVEISIKDYQDLIQPKIIKTVND